MKRILLGIVFYLIFIGSLRSQETNESILQYIERFKEIAISEMKRTGVPASIKLAQGILETGAGTSTLVMKSNNHFGLKCKSWWTGEKVYHDDDKLGECFRKYATPEESYTDHSDYIKSMTWYAFLFKLDPLDYKAWAAGLKKAGYATNPQYTQKLINYIEKYDLNKYSKIALGSFLEQNVDTSKVSNDVKKYPEMPFVINQTKVIFSKEGSSLLAIASEYKIPYLWLLDFNELRNGTDILPKDQLVFLQRKRKTGATEFHLVEEGENLYEISQKEGIKLESLLTFNYLTINMSPAPGEKLYLQKPASNKPKLRL